MSLHKLSAGSGYDYLTRQVAALDATDRGHTGLATFYSERGESPGVWVGTGMVDIDGIQVGDAVSAEQMKALFGAGMHPVEGSLGQPFKLTSGGVSGFRVAVARAVADVASSPAARRPGASPSVLGGSEQPGKAEERAAVQGGLVAKATSGRPGTGHVDQSGRARQGH